ncbi:hypothetical protein V3W47_17425 [Deinococcus sp. YIM 134068]|uniref:choice-of-anchor I domain-containing protein n=1 Tax=Deinococcus lichenicola TaxID=3118910 RepID=UPI002F954C46
MGLERTGGVMGWTLTDPAAPAFLSSTNTVDVTAAPEGGSAGDLGPEGLLFIPAADSPDGQPLLVVANEVSGSTTLSRVGETGTLTRVGRSQTTPFTYAEGAAEIPTYDPATRRLFVVDGATNGLDILDLADPTRPTLAGQVDLGRYGASANSVAVRNGVVAVAVQAEEKTDPGVVAFLNPDGSERAPAVPVGALPDMPTFTPDGTLLLTANEGEPNDDSLDPVGSVSIIDVAGALAAR